MVPHHCNRHRPGRSRHLWCSCSFLEPRVTATGCKSTSAAGNKGFFQFRKLGKFILELKQYIPDRTVTVLGQDDLSQPRRNCRSSSSNPYFSGRWMKITMSASCSIAPDSRRSESCGLLVPVLISTDRLSCDRAITECLALLQYFSMPRNCTYFLLALPAIRRSGHELEVIDDEHFNVKLPLQSPRLRPEFKNWNGRCIIDVYWRLYSFLICNQAVPIQNQPVYHADPVRGQFRFSNN